MRRMHVVMIAPLYPATSGPIEAAAMRARGFATGLAGLGHEVAVVVGMPAGREPDRAGGVEVHLASWPDLRRFAKAPGMSRGKLVEPGRPLRMPFLRAWLSSVFPDRYAFWVPSAVRVARRIVRPDSVVLSTSARSAHIAGRLAHGERPWIADLNDPWAYSPKMTRRRVRDQVEWRMERATVGRATRLTATTPTMSAELERRHNIPATSILSGFNAAEFDGRAPGPRELPRRVLFAGTFYWTIDFRPLYEAVRVGVDEGWLDAAKLRLSFVGHLATRAALEAAEHGISDIVEADELVPRDELLGRLCRADALILPFYDEYTLAMKFFEYVGAGRPIIGYGASDRVAAKLIEQHDLGVTVRDREGFARVLRQLIDDPESLPAPAGEHRLAFTWTHSIATMDELLTAVASDGAVGR
jgi:glycosyltransferase involved in cell wall biosynthesis